LNTSFCQCIPQYCLSIWILLLPPAMSCFLKMLGPCYALTNHQIPPLLCRLMIWYLIWYGTKLISQTVIWPSSQCQLTRRTRRKLRGLSKYGPWCLVAIASTNANSGAKLAAAIVKHQWHKKALEPRSFAFTGRGLLGPRSRFRAVSNISAIRCSNALLSWEQ
jgi:hypothetical protein